MLRPCVLLLFSLWPIWSSAQQLDIYTSGESGSTRQAGLSLGASGSATWYLRPDSVVGFDFATGRRWGRSVPNILSLFATDARPSSNSVAVEPGGNWAWIWDGSVGSVYRLSLQDSVLLDYSRLSSRTQFKHAGGLHPQTHRPLAFSGYGYYRAKEFLLTFDDSLDTWRELPLLPGRAPLPRMGGVMVSGWDSAHVAVVGGTVARPGVHPPEYTLDVDDVWILNLYSGRWKEVNSPGGLACVVRGTEHKLGHVPVDPTRGVALLYARTGCRQEELPAQAVLEWNPATGEVKGLGSIPLTLPVGAFLAAMYPSSDSVSTVFWEPRDDTDLGSWRQWRFSAAYGGPNAVAGWNPWAWLGPLMVVATALGIGLFRRRRSPAPAEAGEPLVRIECRQGGSIAVGPVGELRVDLSTSASILCRFLSESDDGPGSLLDSDKLEDHFLEHYPDPDSSRVVRNRAIDELNKIAREVLGNDLIVRKRKFDDARRYDYRLQARLVAPAVPSG